MALPILLTFNAKTQSLARWAQELGIPPRTVVGRYHQGKPPSEILKTNYVSSVKGSLPRDENNRIVPEYRIWAHMRGRVYTVTDAAYSDYGGRGIRICAGWGSFNQFYADMGSRTSALHSIDRIDNDAHYSCGHCDECIDNEWTKNCRWATRTEQARNCRSNRLVTIDGVIKTTAEWAELAGIDPATLHRRLVIGWTTDDLLLPTYTRRKGD